MSTYLDSHVHLDAAQLSPAALVESLAKARQAGWRGAVLAGYGPEELARAADLCHQHGDLWYAAGLHPWWLADHPDPDAQRAAFAAMERAVAGGQVVAVGELGLDKTRCPELPMAQQVRWLERGLQLAQDNQLPAILHIVGAWQQARAAIAPFARRRLGILHRYGGSAALVADFEGMGLHLSLSVHHLRRAPERARAVAQAISADRLLVETDWSGGDLSYPDAVADLAALLTQLATWRSVARAELARQILANTRAIYHMGLDHREQP